MGFIHIKRYFRQNATGGFDLISIISAISEPDEKAFFTSLYQSLKSTMYWKAYRILGNRDQVEDVLHDSILRLILKYEKLKNMNDASLAYYVLLTVRSTAIDLLRKSNKEKFLLISDFEDVATGSTPEQQYIHNQEIKTKSEVIRQLPEAQRDLLLFKYVLEKSNSELATLYSTSESNIRQMLSRIRRKLNRRLEELL